MCPFKKSTLRPILHILKYIFYMYFIYECDIPEPLMHSWTFFLEQSTALIIIFYTNSLIIWIQKQDTVKKEIAILDPKRSNVINIGLTVLPPPRTIKTAILKMDSAIMNREGIEVSIILISINFLLASSQKLILKFLSMTNSKPIKVLF